MFNKTVLVLAELSPQLGNDEENVSFENIDNSYIDDFKDTFDHIGIKVITAIFFVYCIIFNNGFYFCMVLYEKYGIDPLKHSVIDYLMTLIGWTVILHNLVCSSIWTWRIIIGPLNVILAEFQGFIQCIFLSTVFLNLAEISLIKALMNVRWSVVAGMNDQIIGKFIFGANLGLITTMHLSRYFLGSHRESLHFQILTGLKFGHPDHYFWQIYLVITISISLAALFIIIGKSQYNKELIHNLPVSSLSYSPEGYFKI